MWLWNTDPKMIVYGIEKNRRYVEKTGTTSKIKDYNLWKIKDVYWKISICVSLEKLNITKLNPYSAMPKSLETD